MPGLAWNFDQVYSHLEQISFPVERLSPTIKQIFRVWPRASAFAMAKHSVVFSMTSNGAMKVPLISQHPHFVHEQYLLHILTESGCPYIFQKCVILPDLTCFELVPNGTLHDRMTTPGQLRLRPIGLWMLQLSQAVAGVEAIGWSHGDISPANILVDDDDDITLIDFDEACEIGEPLSGGCEPYIRQIRGPDGSCGHGIAGPASEQFALGSVFWYMLRGSELYSELNDEDVTSRLRDQILPTTDDQDQIEYIIGKCWRGEYPRIADLEQEISEVPMLCLTPHLTDASLGER